MVLRPHRPWSAFRQYGASRMLIVPILRAWMRFCSHFFGNFYHRGLHRTVNIPGVFAGNAIPASNSRIGSHICFFAHNTWNFQCRKLPDRHRQTFVARRMQKYIHVRDQIQFFFSKAGSEKVTLSWIFNSLLAVPTRHDLHRHRSTTILPLIHHDEQIGENASSIRSSPLV